MKPYTEKPTFLLFMAGVLGTAISGVSKDWIFRNYPNHWVRLLLLIAPPIISFSLIYLANLVIICSISSSELHEKLVLRWGSISTLRSAPEGFGRAQDMIDRAAAILVWLKWRVLKLGEREDDPKGLSPSLQKARLLKNYDDLQIETTQLKTETLMPSLAGMKDVWTRSKRISRRPRNPRYIEDPIYGQVVVDPRLIPILSHPLFQRLNYVRQLSFAYLVFPSASHSRLSHILGVMRNVEVALNRIFQKRRIYTPHGISPLRSEDRDNICLKAQLCALLHDMGHGPFGHALDKFIPYFDVGASTDLPDKVYSVKYAEEILADEITQIGEKCGFTLADILNILDKERQMELMGYDGLVLDLIDSPLDVDRMDYLVRDAHMTGLRMGHSNVQALIEHMCPFRRDDGYVNLTYEVSCIPHLENFVYARDIMYIHCYEHPQKVCAERLLVRLAEKLLSLGFKKEDLMLLADEQLFCTMNILFKDMNPEAQFLRSLQGNSKFKVVQSYPLSVWDSANHAMAFNNELTDNVKAWRDLRTKGKAQLKSVFINQPKDWEERICAEARLDQSDCWKVVVTVPAYDAKQEAESRSRVLVKEGIGYRAKDLLDVSEVVRAVGSDLRPVREVIRVMVSEDLSSAGEHAISRAADSIFKR